MTNSSCCNYCPITGVYLKSFLPAVAAAFLFVLAYEYLVHGVLLMDMYHANASTWRSDAEMSELRWYMMLMQFMTVFIVGVIFSKHYEGKGIGEGLRYGLMVGVLMGILGAEAYTWIPISATLASAWFAAGLVKGIGLGVVYALVYRDPKVVSGGCGCSCKCGPDCGCGKPKTEGDKGSCCSAT